MSDLMLERIIAMSDERIEKEIAFAEGFDDDHGSPEEDKWLGMLREERNERARRKAEEEQPAPAFDREAMNEAAIDDGPTATPSYVETLEAVEWAHGAEEEQIALIARAWELPVERIKADLRKMEGHA